MADREMLELAAKAAEIDYESRYETPIGTEFKGLLVQNKLTPVFWNPLTDDGDALRLAVKLEMCIDFMNKRVIAGDSCPDIIIDFEDDYKRAIVHAAAEIGKAML